MSTIPNTSGIYKITCTVTGKFYIGSAVNLRVRRKNHFMTLRGNKHKNPKLQRAFNKYGEQAFTFEVLELVLLPEMLTAREKFWIDRLNPWFNIARVAGSNLRMKQSPEAIEKSRVARTGMKRTPEQCENIGASRRGKPSTNLGKKASPETIERLRQSHLGHKPDPTIYDALRKTYILTAPDGTEYVVHGICKFCREHNLHASALRLVAKGEYSHHKGWAARFPETYGAWLDQST
jgi:group I intron endonuclease